ncbi:MULTISPECIES: alpha/beta fold hydrolase [Prauserella]|nr:MULTISPECIES: alpha/beta hydrolase [Prauserella]PXY17672.1 hypothetical protein BAY59_35665 [Prauserella coralliicola]
MTSTWKDIVGRYIEVDGTPTYYDEIGVGGRPIICVHTAGANALEYRYLLPLLAEAGFHAIALDLPGRARTYAWRGEVTTTIHRHAEFVRLFKRELFGESKVVVTGTSIGGDVTIDLAVSYPEDFSAAIAFEGAARTPTFPDPGEYMQPSWNPGWQDTMERISGAALNAKCPPEKEEELRWMHRNAQVSAVGDLQGWANHDVRDQLSNATIPVLVAAGVEDFWLPEELVDETVAGLPDAEKLMIDGIGHYPMFEAPELICSIIVDFVERKVN